MEVGWERLEPAIMSYESQERFLKRLHNYDQ